jgi:hypothetical protein
MFFINETEMFFRQIATAGAGKRAARRTMWKPSIPWIVPALIALSGCVVGAENARHDMEASKAAYKACLAARGPEACEGQRQAYEADISAYRATPKFVIGAGSPPPLSASGMGTMPAPSPAGPPPLAPLPDMRPRLLVPAGGGAFMELP